MVGVGCVFFGDAETEGKVQERLGAKKMTEGAPTMLGTKQLKDEHSWILYQKFTFINILNDKDRSTETGVYVRVRACSLWVLQVSNVGLTMSFVSLPLNLLSILQYKLSETLIPVNPTNDLCTWTPMKHM